MPLTTSTFASPSAAALSIRLLSQTSHDQRVWGYNWDAMWVRLQSSQRQDVTSRHPSGKKLYEVADVVIDTHGVAGDAVLDLPNTPGRVGGTSTMLGIAIVETITVQAAAHLAERGPVTLMCHCDDEPHCHLRVLTRIIESKRA